MECDLAPLGGAPGAQRGSALISGARRREVGLPPGPKLARSDERTAGLTDCLANADVVGRELDIGKHTGSRGTASKRSRRVSERPARVRRFGRDLFLSPTSRSSL